MEQGLHLWLLDANYVSVPTPGGHHRIPWTEIERLLGERPPGETKIRSTPTSSVSGRNKLQGKVVGVQYEGLLAEVRIDVKGQIITSIITRNAAEGLRLKRGVKAVALIKATDVMVIRG